MKKKKPSLTYRFIKSLVRLFYPKMQVIGAENLPQEPCIVVGNHSHAHGPIACELYFPGTRYTWCIGQMMHKEEVPEYAMRDFWPNKKWYSRWFYKLLSHIIAPIAQCVFTNANTIPVYRDSRTITTFKQTVKRLEEGANVVIFPEEDAKYNHFLYRLHQNFVDVAKLYYRRTRKTVSFVPLYIAPKLHKMYIGKPVAFDPEADIASERKRITNAMLEGITEMAVNLPKHTVIPFHVMPKSQYPCNIPEDCPIK